MPITVEEVIAAYEASCAGIKSFDVHVELTTYSLLEPEINWKTKTVSWSKRNSARRSDFRRSRQRFQDGMFRIDAIQHDEIVFGDGEGVVAWDGLNFKSMSVIEKAGSNSTAAKTQNIISGTTYQNLFITFNGDYSMLDFLRDRPDKTVERNGEQIVLTAKPSMKGKVRSPAFGLRLHLNPTKGFMPETVEYLIRNSDIPQAMFENELGEVMPGLWVPVRATIKSWLREKADPLYGELMGFKELSINLSKSQFNSAVDPTVFSITFPPGLRIRDEVRNVSYVSAVDREDNLIRLAHAGREIVDDLQSKKENAYLSTHFLIALNCMGAVLLLFVVTRRFNRSRRNRHANR